MVEGIKTVGVVGAGTMGSGIAQLCIQKGFEVILVEIDPMQRQKAIRNIQVSLEKLVEKGKISEEEKNSVLNGIIGVRNLQFLRQADFIIEAIFENKKMKQNLFKELDKICPKDIVLASNTSTIPISKIAKGVKRKDRVIGMHFMNPATIMPLIEVIRAETTSESTFRICWDLCEKLGKTPIEAKRDSAGFIMNRVMGPAFNEAIFVLSEGLGTAEDIDKALELGGPYKMGPLKVADLIGLDVLLNILEILYQEFREPKFKPCPLLKEYVDSGRLGRKTGKGFYEYK